MPRSRSEALAEERKKVHENTEIVCLLRCQFLHERSNVTDRLRFVGRASFMTRPAPQALSSQERVAQNSCVLCLQGTLLQLVERSCLPAWWPRSLSICGLITSDNVEVPRLAMFIVTPERRVEKVSREFCDLFC